MAGKFDNLLTHLTPLFFIKKDITVYSKTLKSKIVGRFKFDDGIDLIIIFVFCDKMVHKN